MKSLPTCPCCGHAVKADDILIDASRGAIARFGTTLILPPQQFRLFSALYRRRPAVISKSVLFDQMTDISDPNDAPTQKNVDVQICNLRPDLGDLGMVIDTVYGVGYGLRLLSKAIPRKPRGSKVRRPRAAYGSTEIEAVIAARAGGLSEVEVALRTNLRLRSVQAILANALTGQAVAA